MSETPAWQHKAHAPTSGTVLCKLDDIKDGAAKGFDFGEGREIFRMLVARRDTTVYGYLNECPHAFTPLDFMPDEFMDMGGEYLNCATHGALFNVDDGLCIAGPCRDQYLTAIAVKLKGDDVVVV